MAYLAFSGPTGTSDRRMLPGRRVRSRPRRPLAGQYRGRSGLRTEKWSYVALVVPLRFLPGQPVEERGGVLDGQTGLFSDRLEGSLVGPHQRLQRRVVARDTSGVHGDPHGADLEVISHPGQHVKPSSSQEVIPPPNVPQQHTAHVGSDQCRSAGAFWPWLPASAEGSI